MKRTILVAVALMSLAITPIAKADGLPMKEAKAVAADTFWKATNVYASPEQFNCRRISSTEIRCRVVSGSESNWKMKYCRAAVTVTLEPDLVARLTRRKCRFLERPFLSMGQAERKATQLADPRYRSKDLVSRGGSYSRPTSKRGGISQTRWEVELNWQTETENCLQSMKIALIKGKILGKASKAACTQRPEWPGSSA